MSHHRSMDRLGRVGTLAISAEVISLLAIDDDPLLLAPGRLLYTQLLAFTGASSGLVESVSTLPINALIFICGTLAVAFVMCMFIDQIAFLLLAIPIVQPIMQTYDIEPVYFWMLFVIFMSLGSNTPPFGYNIFTLKAVSSDLELEHIFSAAWKSVGLVLIGVVILLIFPDIIMFVPSRM